MTPAELAIVQSAIIAAIGAALLTDPNPFLERVTVELRHYAAKLPDDGAKQTLEGVAALLWASEPLPPLPH